MAAENSLDVVSKIDMAEVTNAVTQAMKEIGQRFDFKGSKSNITQEKDALVIVSDDEYKLKSVIDILQGKLVKRGVPVKNLSYGKVEAALAGTVRQKITLQQGIPIEKAKEIVKAIKDSKIKVQASIQADQVRVSGKDRDNLQTVIQLLKGKDFGIELQFDNYRST
ncbi:MAG TPA: YajQ family cyclic di-GMP-binding protein [Nitrospirota bacterium]|nr:YajQ family cyclic di-GMP-binding protein [Nitrospirota bacterium]